jgi:hypothetical protein
MAIKFNNIQDLVNAAYGPNGKELASSVMKADAPVLQGTAGVYNTIYGKMTWELINLTGKTLAAIPKKPMNNTGFRVITAMSTTHGTGGVAENGALPDTTKPTWALGVMKLKEIVHTFDMSNRAQMLDDGSDDTIGFAELREYMAREHVAHMNKMILRDADTLAGNDLESLDRICSSQSEESALLTAGDADIYGFDRSASTAYDAYVDHASGTDRALTEAMINEAIDGIDEASGERPNVIITGFDTARAMDALVNDQTRYTNMRVTVGVNGVQTAAGNDVGLRVASYDGIPVLRDKDVQKDGKSRIYFLNTNYIALETKLPTQYFESQSFFETDKLGKEGMFYTAGELVCRRFNAQGKIRDLL